ncbi:hypothetical protein ACFXAW_05600 [Streptomyces sp. NPDC059445]|uniref:hypothetical protein n=1 Tax=Streptomyces sp. NPDC059445 TaxID=3346832 RepID=UPI0036B6DBE8
MHAYDCMTAWLNGRKQYRHAPDPDPEGPPAFGAFYDVGGDSIAAVVHTLLGALVAGLLGTSGQVNGSFAVFAAGASAPLLLVQLKNSRLAEVILGEDATPEATSAVQSTNGTRNGPGPAPDSAGETLPTQRPGADAPHEPSTRQTPRSDSSPQHRAHRPASHRDDAG